MYIFRLRFIFSIGRFLFPVSFLSLNLSFDFLILMDKLTNTLFMTWDNQQVLSVPIHVLTLASFKWMLV